MAVEHTVNASEIKAVFASRQRPRCSVGAALDADPLSLGAAFAARGSGLAYFESKPEQLP
jgi:hypothetical protein